MRDHGAVAPLASVVWGSAVATNNSAGERVVVAPVWTGWNDAGERSSAFLRVNVDNGSTLMSDEVFGDTAFSAFLGADNRLYFSQAGELVAFDTDSGTVSRLGAVPATMPLRFTADDSGRIYLSSYPNAELLRYDPASGRLENFGALAKETWPQYPFIAVDAHGWVYMAVRHKAANLIGFNPQTGERKTYLKPEERVYVDAVEIFRAQDGAVYAKLDIDNRWRKLSNGSMAFVPASESAVKVHRTALRDPGTFADGSRLGAFNTAEKFLTVREAGGSVRRIGFDYKARGARIYSLFAAGGVVYGSTGLPPHTFVFDPASGSLSGSSVAGIPNLLVLAEQGGKLYAGAYPVGELLVYDPSQPVSAGFSRIYKSPQGRTTFGRPTELIAHPDGQHIILVGNPARAIVGGGMMIYNTAANTAEVLTAKDLVADQGTKAILALQQGDLIGGTTVNAPTGGVRVASEAVLYRLDWKTRRIAWQREPFPGCIEVSDLLLTPQNGVLGLSNGGILFRFDPADGKPLGQTSLAAYGKLAGAPGLQTTNVMVNGADGMVYILFGSGVVRVNPQSFEHACIYKADRQLSGSLVRVGNTLFFAAGERLMSLEL